MKLILGSIKKNDCQKLLILNDESDFPYEFVVAKVYDTTKVFNDLTEFEGNWDSGFYTRIFSKAIEKLNE